MASQLLLYRDITPLNREQHRHLKFRPLGNCDFARGSNIVPIAGPEFFAVAHHCPIVFVGEGENLTPTVLLGLTDGHNDFIGEDNRWLPHTYIPAFIRRYPFVLSRDSAEQLTVCIDSAFEGWNESEGEALFGEEGQNSVFLDETIGFLQEFSRALAHTQAFMAKLLSLNLLVSRNLQIKNPIGATFELKNYRMVDDEKFRHLPAKQIRELHQSGFLPWINAHLMSLSRLNDLFDIYLRRQAGLSACQKAATDVEE
jgi:hypothetical protein